MATFKSQEIETSEMYIQLSGDSLEALELKIRNTIDNVLKRRDEMHEYLKEEYTVAKLKNNSLSHELIFSDSTIKLTRNGSVSLSNDEFSAVIYPFKKALAKLHKARRATEMAREYGGIVSITSDIPNLISYFDPTNDSSVLAVQKYITGTVNSFICRISNTKSFF